MRPVPASVAPGEHIHLPLHRLAAAVAQRDLEPIDHGAPLPHVGVSWLHELILIADHSAWHLGQLLLQRCLEASARRRGASSQGS